MDTYWGRDGGLITATHLTHTTDPMHYHKRQKIQNEQKKWLGLLTQKVLSVISLVAADRLKCPKKRA